MSFVTLVMLTLRRLGELDTEIVSFEAAGDAVVDMTKKILKEIETAAKEEIVGFLFSFSLSIDALIPYSIEG